jgi:hypothetical protein
MVQYLMHYENLKSHNLVFICVLSDLQLFAAHCVMLFNPHVMYTKMSNSSTYALDYVQEI